MYDNSHDNLTLQPPYGTVENPLVADSIGIYGRLIVGSSIEQTDVITGQQNFAVNLERLDLAPSPQVQEAVQQITNSFLGDLDGEDLSVLNLQSYSPFESGVFTVGETGEFSFTWLFDGGGYQGGQLAAFSLQGMESLEPRSRLFIQEAARRASSNSEEGGIIFDDQSEGSQFSGVLGTSDSKNFNSGEYRGAKTFKMRPGETFALMLVPNGKARDVYENPSIEGAKRPLFSLATANPNDAFHTGQLADVFGDGTSFVMEDLRVDTGSDRDYNDWIFRVQGAIGYAALLKDVINPNNQWQYSELGQKVLAQVSTNDNPDKSVPGKPVRDPTLPTPVIPSTSADQGSNNLTAPTRVESSPTQDIIDQVSSTDPTDIYQIPIQSLIGTQIEVLQGQITVNYSSPSGQPLGRQVISEGKQTLALPNGISGDVLLKIDNVNGTTGTYILPGFESKAPEPFNIQFEFGDGLSDSQRTTIESAARSIELMIKQGLPSAIVNGKIIDDLNIKLSLADLDGRDGTLAQTKNDYLRYGTLLPAQSIVQLDRADVAGLEQSGRLFNMMQHELLHALGFGNLWEAKGLIDYAKTPFARYTGQNAIAAFGNAGGSTSFIPLETVGNGSADLHWHEGLFGDEVMTNDLNSQGNTVTISPVTLASLTDLGYQVNIDQATPNWRLASSAPPDAEKIFSEESNERLAELVAAAEAQPSSDIPTIIAPVDPATISPTIWAHAERFDVNGEYYDWQLITVGNWRNGNTISEYVQDRMTNPSKLDNRSPGAKALDPRYWQFIVDRNRAFGIERPELIYEGEQLYLPVWNQNYEQKQEEERKRREAELRQKEEEEKRQREKLEEAYRQNGQGGLEWYLAKTLPEFSSNAPYETSIRDLVGSLVPDDYFRFTVSRPGYVTLYLEDLLADADLYLYDSRNRLIAKSTRGGITDEKIIANLAAGTYLARVHSPVGITTDYNLKVRFDGIPSHTQQGNSSSSGGRKSTFSDPRIERIFTQARDKFTTEQWKQAQPGINQLENQKQQKQQELDALLAQAIAEQRAKIYAQLDGVRNDIQGKVSGGANNVRNVINGVADGAINSVNSLVPGWLKDILDRIDLGDDVQNAQNSLRGVINDARNWLNGQVDSVRNQINGAVGQFIEMVKNAYMTGGEINQAIENAANWLKGETDRLANFLNDKIGEFKGQILGKLEWTKNIRIPDWARKWPINAPDWNLYDHAIVGLVNGLASGASNAVNSASNFFKDTVSVVKPLAQGAVAAIVDAIFGDKTGKLYNEIKGINQQIENIKSGVQNLIGKGVKFIQGVVQQIEKVLSDPEERRRVLDALFQRGYKDAEDALGFVNQKLPEIQQQILKESEAAIKKIIDDMLPAVNGIGSSSVFIKDGISIVANAIVGAKVKGSSAKKLIKQVENGGKTTYFVAQEGIVGVEGQLGVKPKGKFSAGGKSLSLSGAEVTGEANLGLELTYAFDPEKQGDMFKLASLLFSDTVLQPLLPSPLNTALDRLTKQTLESNLDSIKSTGGLILGSSAELLSSKIGASVALQVSSLIQRDGKAIASIEGGFSGNAGIGLLFIGIDGSLNGKIRFSLEKSNGSSNVNDISMTIEVSGARGARLDFLDKYGSDSGPVISKIIENHQDGFLQSVEAIGEALHGYKLDFHLHNPGIVANQSVRILNDLLDGKAASLEMLQSLLNLFEILKNSSSLEISAIKSDKFELELEGAIIVGGGINGSVGSGQEKQIFSWGGSQLLAAV